MQNIIPLIIYTIPLYITNASCTLAALVKKRHPIDFKKKLGKYRVLGDGKTIEGALIGFTLGALASIITYLIWPQFLLIVSITANAFALLGDTTHSFIKRRLGIKRGESWFLVDQLDFMAVSYIYLVFYITMDFISVIVMFGATIVIHRATNIIAYHLKLKKVPW
jgi:CDP-2,3-bis-(O-geranylgeranyl)-sn-glycerol synthase